VQTQNCSSINDSNSRLALCAPAFEALASEIPQCAQMFLEIRTAFERVAKEQKVISMLLPANPTNRIFDPRNQPQTTRSNCDRKQHTTARSIRNQQGHHNSMLTIQQLQKWLKQQQAAFNSQVLSNYFMNNSFHCLVTF
jgi:hypothetical protein